MGDIFDRGDDDLPIQEWVYELAQEAGRANGALYSVMGNHEVRARGGDGLTQQYCSGTCGISPKGDYCCCSLFVLQVLHTAVHLAHPGLETRHEIDP